MVAYRNCRNAVAISPRKTASFSLRRLQKLRQRGHFFRRLAWCGAPSNLRDSYTFSSIFQSYLMRSFGASETISVDIFTGRICPSTTYWFTAE